MIKNILLAVLLLGVLHSCKHNDNNFAVDHIEDITRVEIEDKSNQVILSGTSNQWFISSFAANTRSITNLKKILTDIEVEYPMPKGYENTYNNSYIIENGVFIKAYNGKSLVKSYYMLSDSIGNIALMNEKAQPYMVNIPGQGIRFQDYIVTESAFWENNVVFSFYPEEIKQIKLEDNLNTDNSYVIKKDSATIKLYDLDKREYAFDSLKMNQYITYFSNVSFDRNLNENEKQDITLANPLYVLSVETKNGKLDCYILPIEDNGTDGYGNPVVYNRDFFTLVIPEKNIYAKAKWISFDILLEELKYFII